MFQPPFSPGNFFLDHLNGFDFPTVSVLSGQIFGNVGFGRG